MYAKFDLFYTLSVTPPHWIIGSLEKGWLFNSSDEKKRARSLLFKIMLSFIHAILNFENFMFNHFLISVCVFIS